MPRLSQSSRNRKFAKSVLRMVFKSLETFLESFQLSDLNEMQSEINGDLDFLKVVRMVFWSGVVGPGFRSLARSRFALGARTIALRAHCRATRSKARLVNKSN